MKEEEEEEYIEICNESPRLTVHGMVAKSQTEASYLHYVKAIESFLDESEDFDLYEQDDQGRTGLHVAVQSRNVEAVVALLMCGTNVNACDVFGKTPFTYCLESYNMSKNNSNQLFFTFLGHVHKLIAMGLPVNGENRRCYKKARVRHVFNDKQLQNSYTLEIDKMQDVRVGPSTNLRDILDNGANIIALSSRKRQSFVDVLTSSDFYREFPKLSCLLKLQYRRGLRKRKLMQYLKNALNLISRINVPDICSENIIQYFDDEDIHNLLEATCLDHSPLLHKM